MISIVDGYNVLGLTLNLIGTKIIMDNTYGHENYPGVFYGGAKTANILIEIDKRNRVRIENQKLGFRILLTGFAVQVIAIFLPAQCSIF